MARRRSLAVLVLMMVLTLSPNLARAAIACAPHCCPAMADRAFSTPAKATPEEAAQPGAADLAGDDCRSGFANRTCCAEASAPFAVFAPFAPVAHDLPAFPPALLPAPMTGMVEALRVPAPRAEAERVLRTSPLRLSVVRLI